jgi:uncharacterized tellurite resistance protein B-like protein
MSLRTLFGGKDPEPELWPRPDAPADTETETVRRVVAAVDALSVEERRQLAGAAYVLMRVAHADLAASDEELAEIDRLARERTGLTPDQAQVLVDIVRNQSELVGGTEDYVVTRQFAAEASAERRMNLLRYGFDVAAVDGSITADEVATLNEVGKELGFAASEVDAIRLEHRDQLAAIQRMRTTVASDG